MNDVRRFLRYTLPGIACAIQLLIAYISSDNQVISDFILKKDNVSIIGLVIGAFIASGGIGYLFSILYFSFYWTNPFLKYVAIDHKQLFQNLSELIEIRNADGKVIPLDSIDKKDAWKIFTRYWFSNYESFECIRGINSTTDRLVDVSHALGATIVGTAIVIILWFLLSTNPSIFILLVWIIFLIMMIRTYLGTMSSLQSLTNSTLTEVIREKNASNQSRVILWFSK